MAKVICAISGLELKVSHIAMTLNNREMAHPIFYLKQKYLLNMYEHYLKGRYNEIDTYLLFLALLNSTDHVKFACPVKYRGAQTQKIIANNMDKLLEMMWKTAVISHPRFKQPRYVVKEDIHTNSLRGISDWLKAWETNIELFHMGYAREKHRAQLATAEQKLEKIILSGTTGPHLAVQVANWACSAAEFPEDVAEDWKKTIRKCFNSAAMFSTDKKKLLAIKEYCEINIEAGTIHFHSLMKVLREGIRRHDDFLGLGTLPLAPNAKHPTYQLLNEKVATKENEALLSIIANAPTEQPIRSNYSSDLHFLRAKLAYRLYLTYQKSEAKGDTTNE